MNPYETLDVPRDATLAQVKAAYKAKAKALHPDVGGDAAEFRKLQAAYELLCDPDRRRTYDETGAAEEPSISLRGQAVAQLGILFTALVDNVQDLDRVDMVAAARREIDVRLGQAAQAGVQAQTKAAKLRAAAKRFKCPAGSENFPAAALLAKADELDKARATCEKQEALCKEMKAALAGFSYKAEKGEWVDASADTFGGAPYSIRVWSW